MKGRLSMLEVNNLSVDVEDKHIVKDISFTVKPGEIVALLGPNGSGKSTIAYALAGHPKYDVVQGKIILDAKDITKAKPHERAKQGLFLGFQHPQEISGVTVTNFLRMAVKAKTGKEQHVMEFYQQLKDKMKDLKMDEQFALRYVNEGFSGGEKKRLEVLQLHVLQPKFAILDEQDSGLDSTAMKTIAGLLKEIIKENNIGVLLISHYQKFLHYLKPDRVLVLKQGKLVKEGNASLIDEIEKKGFDGI